MNWPATSEELKEAGYIDIGRSKWCSCGEIMFWFVTPAKKFIPLSIACETDRELATVKISQQLAAAIYGSRRTMRPART
ncbi:MAG: hypothetical protein ACRD4S_16865 [Candidatus Acidiferrales bacterium]